jgi:hypothetical protein
MAVWITGGMSHNGYVVNIHKTGINSTTTEAREKISTYPIGVLRILEKNYEENKLL